MGGWEVRCPYPNLCGGRKIISQKPSTLRKIVFKKKSRNHIDNQKKKKRKNCSDDVTPDYDHALPLTREKLLDYLLTI